MVENIVGFAAVGLVLGRTGFLRATVIGALISTLSEAGQFFMAHRDPSIVDVVSNVTGTMLGAWVSGRWKVIPTELGIGRWRAGIAAVLGAALMISVWHSSGDPYNERGVTAPGVLEARWSFDEASGAVVTDDSGHQMNGTLRNHPGRAPGVRGGAIVLDGAKAYVDAGRSSAFRMAGSMTISAWIRSTAYPRDDAAIVSQLQNKAGYQLDTTIDRGLRGIGFKLTDSCGEPMARYGRTPLAIGTWYHVAGVYDSEARTLDVYLNGVPDNGDLMGTVTGRQRSSRAEVYLGRRRELDEFEFAGSLDDVRIYSFALTKEEVAADMRGAVIGRSSEAPIRVLPADAEGECVMSEHEDAKIPAAAATLGALVGIACVGFAPFRQARFYLAASLAAGLLLVPLMAASVPVFSRWMMPVVSLAGGASIAVSLRRREV